MKEARTESKVVVDQEANERQTREIEHLKRQLTEVQVECDQLKEAEEVQSKRHKKDRDLIGDRVDQLERENEMVLKEKEIIGNGFIQLTLIDGPSYGSIIINQHMKIRYKNNNSMAFKTFTIS